jgi:hypothetical protein
MIYDPTAECTECGSIGAWDFLNGIKPCHRCEPLVANAFDPLADHYAAQQKRQNRAAMKDTTIPSAALSCKDHKP